jgi:hypothetical protein
VKAKKKMMIDYIDILKFSKIVNKIIKEKIDYKNTHFVQFCDRNENVKRLLIYNNKKVYIANNHFCSKNYNLQFNNLAKNMSRNFGKAYIKNYKVFSYSTKRVIKDIMERESEEKNI